METPKVAVVILNYNGLHWLKQFLKTVVEKSSSADIYVADNASTDLSLSFVENHFPQVKVVKNKNNSGYAAGYNHALQEICADYYILLNSDVEVTDNWITPIIDVMENDTTIAALFFESILIGKCDINSLLLFYYLASVFCLNCAT